MSVNARARKLALRAFTATVRMSFEAAEPVLLTISSGVVLAHRQR